MNWHSILLTIRIVNDASDIWSDSNAIHVEIVEYLWIELEQKKNKRTI